MAGKDMTIPYILYMWMYGGTHGQGSCGAMLCIRDMYKRGY